MAERLLLLPPDPLQSGRMLLMACGAVQILHGSHEADTEMSCLCFSRDEHTLLSRGCDNTLKVGTLIWGAAMPAVPQGLCLRIDHPRCWPVSA